MTDKSRAANVHRRTPILRRTETQINATTINGKYTPSASNQSSYVDEFEASISTGLLLPTPYNVATLLNMISQSNMIPQCVESYVVNIVLTGWEVGPASRNSKVDENEQVELQSFIDYANSDESLMSVGACALRDREYLGFGFIEVIRDALGRMSLLRWAPAYRTRLAPRHEEAQLVEYDIPRGRRTVTVKEWRKFRRFAQVVAGNMIWFKEFGDPRKLDSVSGAFEGESTYQPGRDATEILHLKNPSNEAYGVPRWVNQTPSVIGSREAEEVNMRYFQDNTVPAMFLTVSGGRLTAASHKELQRVINGTPGESRQNKITLLEAVGESDSLDSKGTPIQLKVEKLTDVRQSDALFGKYDEAAQAKIRSSFRLSPILVGMANDQTYDNAGTALFAAETQVFAPERTQQDEIYNRKLVNGKAGLGLKTVKLVSRTPAITSPEQLIKSMTALNTMGAVTPRAAQLLANATLQIEIPPYPQPGEAGYEDWMDKPIIFAARTKTDAEQNLKDQSVKDVEKTGDTRTVSPENSAK